MKNVTVHFTRRRKCGSSVSYGIRIASIEMLQAPEDAARAVSFLLAALDDDYRVDGIELNIDSPSLSADYEKHHGFWVFVTEAEQTEQCATDMTTLGERLLEHLSEQRVAATLAGYRGVQ